MRRLGGARAVRVDGRGGVVAAAVAVAPAAGGARDGAATVATAGRGCGRGSSGERPARSRKVVRAFVEVRALEAGKSTTSSSAASAGGWETH